MSKAFRTSFYAAAVAATTLASLPAAHAGERRSNYSGGDMVAAGVLGLAAGALIAGAASQPRVIYEYERPVRHSGYRYYRSRPSYEVIYTDDLEPWSRAWFRYCSARYRSFNPDTGTYISYDGQRRFCVAD